MVKPFTIVLPTIPPAERRKAAADERKLNAEIGKLVRGWSLLHEEMGKIFAWVVDCDVHVAHSVWHSIKSDLAQRVMLLQAIKARLALLQYKRPKAGEEKQFEAMKVVLPEYIWAIGQITAHSDKRNDIVHGPIMLLWKGTEYEITMDTWGGNPRAIKMRDVELFRFCRYCIAFSDEYTRFLRASLSYYRANGTLLERPRVPPVDSFPSRTERPRRKKPTPRKRPPRSSRA